MRRFPILGMYCAYEVVLYIQFAGDARTMVPSYVMEGRGAHHGKFPKKTSRILLQLLERLTGMLCGFCDSARDVTRTRMQSDKCSVRPLPWTGPW